MSIEIQSDKKNCALHLDLTSFLIDYGSILVLVYPNTTRLSHFAVSYNNYIFI